jgi:5-methylcytosine-specific restriction endonuclease McrA
MNSKVKYSKELLESIAKVSLSVADVIRKLGLRQSGRNHSHITKRLKIYNIDGNGTNNSKENLRFLCPNCHSQTSNYGAKNINKWQTY